LYVVIYYKTRYIAVKKLYSIDRKYKLGD